MLKNYLLVAWRTLHRHKAHTVIHVLGLAFGMTACLLILLFVQRQWSYDDFHEHKDSIFSLYIQELAPDGEIRNRRLIPLGIPESITHEIAGIRAVVQLAAGDVTVIHGGEAFRQAVFEADPTFLQVFSFPLLAGDPQTALVELNNVVISENLAAKYFGITDIRGFGDLIGRTLSVAIGSGTRDFMVSGVMQKCPANSSLQVEMLIPFENYAALPLGSNDVNGRTSTYILLEKDQLPQAVEENLRPFTALHLKDRIASQQADGQLAKTPDALQLRLQPITELHVNPKIPVGYEQPTHNPSYSYVLATIGFLVLLVACINFTTLSLARAASRAREVGMRKAVGAYKKQLMMQFWGEAILVSLLALLVALACAYWMLPLFNALAGTELEANNLYAGVTLFSASCLMVLVGLASGSYPALVLSRLPAASVLKGDLKIGGVSWLTRSLVGLQFTVSSVLMVCAGVMLQQFDFLQGKDLGFNDDLVVVFRTRGDGNAATVEKYRTALAGYDQVSQVVGAGQAFSRSEDTRLLSDPSGTTQAVYVYGVDYDYLDLFEMKLIAGRNFLKSFTSDPASGVLVNEALVREFGLQAPVGHRLNGLLPGLFTDPPTILGVVRDFNFKSLHNGVKPAVLTMHPDYWARYRNIYVKIRPRDVAATVDLLKQKWNVVAPNSPFDYFFLDEDIQKQYDSEGRWVKIMRYATFTALGTSCMGLFAFAALVAGKRMREIGVRKVLGASVPHLFFLLCKDFLSLSVISFGLAAPMAYFAMKAWLQNFAYRVEIGPVTFVAASVLTLIAVLCTVSFHAGRAAIANPADTLRYE